MFDRNVRAFGTAIQVTLEDLKIGVIGCGGTGSAVVEQLTRLGVRRYLLIDPESLAPSNLTRVYGSGHMDIGRPKVNIASDLVKRIAPNAVCEVVESMITTSETARLLASCDVIFGCTDDSHIGNPMLPALHGGVTAAFLEVTAIIELGWTTIWEEMENGRDAVPDTSPLPVPRLPKTIDFTVDYLRSGLPRDAFARARVNRSGRRYASVHVEAWQDNRTRLFAQATGHFLMPDLPDGRAR